MESIFCRHNKKKYKYKSNDDIDIFFKLIHLWIYKRNQMKIIKKIQIFHDFSVWIQRKIQ